MASTTTPLIQVKNLHLYFGAFHALKDVSVDFRAGELIGLVGDNGAGKTTLIRVLCGIHTPSSGEVWFDGRKVEKFHPKLAIDEGIETIQQSVGLCDNLSIARNFYLGREPVKRILGIPILDFALMREKSTKVIREFGLRDNVSADDEVERLSGGERQSVKIGRAVEFKNRVVIMDEPTNHLSVREREHVNELAVSLKEQGLLVIYITHDIFQVHKLADRIVIMENGEKIEDASTHTMSAEALEEVIRQGGRKVTKKEPV
ncbi:ATP-binding cassette domain-containing protein [Paenirhodobacter populi]|uniref:Sugar ABC transporter ATP-binding protein n=1 Tax=Paenirhodobacter populi TaxID=2306993 RepID=A0A443KLK6_9RHOB|nr:ATP-binding cassette domain-containing protein [Sinirhodobacter populi]RWR04894.1 sugar ABC transporter ATP-binding protein [Sinirhodobacter populi]RWR14285.1 sugar ABC transporter ATP-binding protein [Sinirhodobacter populi]RWR17689.1 sugar ABC transporter ATP-binding protein [Sinirhodobacter populi]RWR31930.1 sugar ABC transporter ATP-binding protein [Sinirhodobacter populi]RWR33682.1 sugar ABC transporter ATP-binding protein [Sinirhodobacter populi]